MKRLRTFVLGVALATSAMGLVGCGDKPPPAAPKREAQPAWQDVFDGTPDLYAVVHPTQMKRDAVYGNFFAALMRVARARAEAAGATALEAAEGCDEILIGVSRKEGQPEEAAIVFRGVPSNLDPQKMTDSAGHPLFRLVDAHAKVPELERLDRRSAVSGSLFVLPDRTWVIAMGDARARARQAFASPFGRPAPRAPKDALASIRLDANAFLKGGRNPAMAVLTKKLTAVTVALEPAKGGVIATLRYADEDGTAWAEMQVKRLIADLASGEGAGAPPPERPAAAGPRRPTTPPPAAQPQRLAWLKDAQVARDGNAVVVRLPVPPRLLEELPGASGGDFAF